MYLVPLGDDLTSDCVVRFKIFLVSQTYLVQPDLLVRYATGLEFGKCIVFRKQMVVRSIDTVRSYTFFFAYSVIQRMVTGCRC